MPAITVVWGILFIGLGIGGYFLTDRVSITALIPAFFGVPVVALGLLSHYKQGARKHAMHVVMLLLLLAMGGTAKGVVKAIKSLSGESLERPEAVWAQTIMFVLALILLVLGIRSFIAARKASENS